ncbi:FAR1 DNA binding domain [Macleaya cordata]|uniref:FAR1 DNA binding domain n=1 Tax=Macleaya cordata TaxID=56857 RepID=A0A200Q320_MACCD|nr:FAR1 DNA binding domain [Macleaya cordata]
MRTDCKAIFRIARNRDTGKWYVNDFREDHNHALVTPSKRILLRTNRHMPAAARDLSEIFRKEKIQVSKVASIFGGSLMNAGFDQRDV